jgi:anti-sigma factor RsiW
MEAALVAYVDGELDLEEAREIERLIESDPRAQEKVRAQGFVQAHSWFQDLTPVSVAP